MSARTDAIDTITRELEEALTAMEPEHEGLRDFASLNLSDVARREVVDAIADYDRRKQYIQGAIGQLTAARSAVTTLEDDGFPQRPKREIVAAAYAELQRNAETIQAALAKFDSGGATSLGLRTGAPESKP